MTGFRGPAGQADIDISKPGNISMAWASQACDCHRSAAYLSLLVLQCLRMCCAPPAPHGTWPAAAQSLLWEASPAYQVTQVKPWSVTQSPVTSRLSHASHLCRCASGGKRCLRLFEGLLASPAPNTCERCLACGRERDKYQLVDLQAHLCDRASNGKGCCSLLGELLASLAIRDTSSND